MSFLDDIKSFIKNGVTTVINIGSFNMWAINRSEQWGYFVIAVEKDFFKDLSFINKVLLKVISGLTKQTGNYNGIAKEFAEWFYKKNLKRFAVELKKMNKTIVDFTENMNEADLKLFIKYFTPLLQENCNFFNQKDLELVYKKAGFFLPAGERKLLVNQKLTRYIGPDGLMTHNGKTPSFDIYIFDESFSRSFSRPTHPDDSWLIYDWAVYVADRKNIEVDDNSRINMGGSFTNL